MSITPPRDEASVAVRQRLYVDAKRAAVWGLGVNFVLVLSKLAGGIATGSAALVADAVNSIGDVASSMAVRGALSMAQVEEDDDHPYGHTKAESIAGLSVSLLVAFSAGFLALETIKRFGSELEVPGIAAGVIVGACFARGAEDADADLAVLSWTARHALCVQLIRLRSRRTCVTRVAILAKFVLAAAFAGSRVVRKRALAANITRIFRAAGDG